MTHPLLRDTDPDPVFLRHGSARCLLTVEHAGRAVPAVLGDLGLPEGEIDRHIGWDIGALELAMALATRIDAPLIAQRYSRLVIDCNRPWEADDLVPAMSDSTPVPANHDLAPDDRQQRWDALHVPFHSAVGEACDDGAEALLAVHSYDPRRHADDAIRPWPVGLLWRQENPLAAGLAAQLGEIAAVGPIGLNQPYEIEDTSDFTIPVHAEARDLPHVLIEVRNDFLRNAQGVMRMAEILSNAFFALETQ